MADAVAITRRRAAALLAGAAVAPILAPGARAAPAPALEVVILADLHSAYERLAQLLAAIDARIAAAPAAPRLIVINGDIFEQGNVVAARSQGALDWAFVAALTKRAPVVLNIGNHEADLTLDLAATVERARGFGVTVLSNIVDARSGRPYAEAYAALTIGDRRVSIVGMGVASLFTYPKEVRPTLTIPAAPDWAKANLPAMLGGVDIGIVLSHAGVTPDKDILPLLPDGTLLVGGHDHLLFRHDQGRTRYVHTGSWNRGFGVASFTRQGEGWDIGLERIDIALDAPADAGLAAQIAAAMAAHLADKERAVIGRVAAPLSLDETGRAVARIIAAARGGAVGLIGHTTFGTGLPGGALTQYGFDAVLRFEGDLMTAEIDADTLAAIYRIANQDRDMPLAARLGDYVYANPVAIEVGRTYRLVTNDWTVKNQQAYLGRADIAFQPIPGAKLKPTVIAALRG